VKVMKLVGIVLECYSR